MYSFTSDYEEGAHPRILNALIESNFQQTEGYGLDPFSVYAADIIRSRTSLKADIHFIPGGTQTNLIAISAFLNPYEAVISAKTGHIDVHETGAIEAVGHKILSVAAADGKLTPALIQPVLESHTDEHMVKPRLVYISSSTELGTVYSKQELEGLSVFCREKDLILYMDGARLGAALTCTGTDVTLHDIAELTDAFYIGGTKNGALLGEALVICRDELKKDMRFHIKQKGALLAKGRVLGIQFLELFRDGLYYELARHANAMADILREAITEAGFTFMSDSPTNQIFPVLSDKLVEKLKDEYRFHVWGKTDEKHTCIRLVTSWATPETSVRSLLQSMKNYTENK